MNTSPQPVPLVEIEAKFLGGESELERIVAWFQEHGYGIDRREPVHRVHVYFDAQDCLRNGGSRLRCIIAPGEWCRYDFKADDLTGRGETTEVSLKKSQPIPLQEAITGLATSLPETPPRSALLAVRDFARVILVMTGTHRKAIASRDGLKLELSWDFLVPLEAGIPLTEIEIELLDGGRADFDTCVKELESALQLARSSGSKLESALAQKAS